jgi:hypothetical protein
VGESFAQSNHLVLKSRFAGEKKSRGYYCSLLPLINSRFAKYRQIYAKVEGVPSVSSMSKLLPAVLAATALFVSINLPNYPATARSCVAATSCGQQPIRFVPGQRITVEVANLTQSVVQLQQVAGTDPLSISPGQVRSFVRGGTTEPNFSLVMWDAIGLPLRVNLLKPSTKKLRVEVRPGGRPPGERTVYLKDDGRVSVF